MANQENNAEATTEIKQLVDNWANAVRNEDMKSVLAYHTDDILMFDVPLPLQSKGINAYRKTWEHHFSWSQMLGVFDVSGLEITADKGVAFCTGIIHCAGNNANKIKEEFKVRLTMCFQKLNNQWMIKHEHHSLPSE